MTDEQLSIESGVMESGKAACRLSWPGGEALIEPDVALATARDLHAAAARAETDIALIGVLRNRLGADLQVVGAMLRDVRAARPLAAGKVALRIEAVAGAGTGQPYVHIARGSLKASLTPEDAREMADHWVEAAVGAQIDVRLRYVLGEYDELTPDDVKNIFAGMRRAAGANP